MRTLAYTLPNGDHALLNLDAAQTVRYIEATGQVKITFAGVADNVSIPDPDQKLWKFLRRMFGSQIFDADSPS